MPHIRVACTLDRCDRVRTTRTTKRLRQKRRRKRSVHLSISRAKTSLCLVIGCLLLIVAGSVFAGPFVGINYGPFHKSGQMPGTAIPDSQFISDLGIMSQKFTDIKTYGDDAASRLNRVVPIAAAQFPQLRIYQGVFEKAASTAQPTPPTWTLRSAWRTPTRKR